MLFLYVLDGPRRDDKKKFGETRAWAIERGYELPKRPGAGWNIAILIGLFVGIIPGLVIWVVKNKKQDAYRSEMRTLKNRFIDQQS